MFHACTQHACMQGAKAQWTLWTLAHDWGKVLLRMANASFKRMQKNPVEEKQNTAILSCLPGPAITVCQVGSQDKAAII